MNKSVAELVDDLITRHEGGASAVAALIGVAESSVYRWASGHCRPRPAVERNLRMLAVRIETSGLGVHEPRFVWTHDTRGEQQRAALDELLREVREVLHKGSRLASRNEALDEVCKLLLAHITSLLHGGLGIARSVLAGSNADESRIAEGLRDFVASTLQEHLHGAFGADIPTQEFNLRLTTDENLLAIELIRCFEKHRQLLSEPTGLRDIDTFNEVFGKFLSDSFAEEKELGQYLTPPEVVKFMVSLVLSSLAESEVSDFCDPRRVKDAGLVLDPSCGVGSFLAEALRQLAPEVVMRHGQSALRPWLVEMLGQSIVGIDKSERMARLSRANLALFGFEGAQICLANALATYGPDADLTNRLRGRARLIFTNPPFGASYLQGELKSYRIATVWARRPPVRVDSEILFLERYLEWLAPGGHCAVVVPDSVLANGGLYEDLRKALREHIEIQNVVSLPSETFGAAGTLTKTSVLHFVKHQREANRRRAFVAVCSDVGFHVSTRGAQKRRIANGKGDLPRLLQEATAQDSAPSIGRFIRDLESNARWDAVFHSFDERILATRQAGRSEETVRVRDIASLSIDRTDPRRLGAGSFRYVEISDVDGATATVAGKRVQCVDAPSRARKRIRAGDVLFSTVRPDRRTAGVVGSDLDEAVCTTGFAVLRPKGVDPYSLVCLLQSEAAISQILRHNKGVAYPAIDEECLLDVVLPITREQLEEFADVAGHLHALEAQVRLARQSLRDLVNQKVQAWSDDDVQSNPQTSSIVANHVPSPISQDGF